jgi:hypothetical protein
MARLSTTVISKTIFMMLQSALGYTKKSFDSFTLRTCSLKLSNASASFS